MKIRFPRLLPVRLAGLSLLLFLQSYVGVAGAQDCGPETIVQLPLSDFYQAFPNGAHEVSFNWFVINQDRVLILYIAIDPSEKINSIPICGAQNPTNCIPMTGFILQQTNCDGTATVRGTIHYDSMPIEVVSFDLATHTVMRIVDAELGSSAGSFSQILNFVFDIPAPLDPNTPGLSLNLGLARWKHLEAHGYGTAPATGDGPFGFAPGAQIEVSTSQVGAYLAQASSNAQPLSNSFPVEYIHLRELK